MEEAFYFVLVVALQPLSRREDRREIVNSAPMRKPELPPFFSAHFSCSQICKEMNRVFSS